jgi:hypothetical protein
MNFANSLKTCQPVPHDRSDYWRCQAAFRTPESKKPSSQNWAFYMTLGDAGANRDGKITTGEIQAYPAENVSRQAGMINRVK